MADQNAAAPAPIFAATDVTEVHRGIDEQTLEAADDQLILVSHRRAGLPRYEAVSMVSNEKAQGKARYDADAELVPSAPVHDQMARDREARRKAEDWRANLVTEVEARLANLESSEDNLLALQAKLKALNDQRAAAGLIQPPKAEPWYPVASSRISAAQGGENTSGHVVVSTEQTPTGQPDVKAIDQSAVNTNQNLGSIMPSGSLHDQKEKFSSLGRRSIPDDPTLPSGVAKISLQDSDSGVFLCGMGAASSAAASGNDLGTHSALQHAHSSATVQLEPTAFEGKGVDEIQAMVQAVADGAFVDRAGQSWVQPSVESYLGRTEEEVRAIVRTQLQWMNGSSARSGGEARRSPGSRRLTSPPLQGTGATTDLDGRPVAQLWGAHSGSRPATEASAASTGSDLIVGSGSWRRASPLMGSFQKSSSRQLRPVQTGEVLHVDNFGREGEDVQDVGVEDTGQTKNVESDIRSGGRKMRLRGLSLHTGETLVIGHHESEGPLMGHEARGHYRPGDSDDASDRWKGLMEPSDDEGDAEGRGAKGQGQHRLLRESQSHGAVNSYSVQQPRGSTASRPNTAVRFALQPGEAREYEMERVGSDQTDGDLHKSSAENDEKKSRRSALEDEVPVTCRSFFFSGFTRDSAIRQTLHKVHTLKRWRMAFLFFSILHVLSIILRPEIDSGLLDGMNIPNTTGTMLKILDYLDSFCVTVFALELASGIVTCGFIFAPNPWLFKSQINKLDLLIFLFIIFGWICESVGFSLINIMAFRIVRGLRVLVLFKAFEDLQVIMQTLVEGLPQLVTVSGMVVFILLAEASIGMATLRDSYGRRCVIERHYVPSCASDFSTGWAARCDLRGFSGAVKQSPSGAPLAGPGWERDSTDELISVITAGYPFSRGCKMIENVTAGEFDRIYPLDERAVYHDCQVDQYLAFGQGAVTQRCAESDELRNWYSQHFDDVWGAVLTLAQSTAPDSYYDVIYRSTEAEKNIDSAYWALWILLTLLNTFLLLGIFVAVVTGTFARIRERDGAAFSQLSQPAEAPAAPEDNEGDGSRGLLQTLNRGSLRNLLENVKNVAVGQQDRQAVRQRLAESSQRVLDDRFFVHFCSAVIVAQETPPASPLGNTHVNHAYSVSWNAAQALLVALIPAFALSRRWHSVPTDRILNPCGAGLTQPAPYFVSFFRSYVLYAPANARYLYYCNLVCNSVFFFEVFLRLAASGPSFEVFFARWMNRVEVGLNLCGTMAVAGYGGAWIFLPVLRTYRLVRYFPTLSHMLSAAVSSVSAVFNLLVFISILTVAFTVTGRYTFGDTIEGPMNFSTFADGILTIFQLLIGDSWSTVLYRTIDSRDTPAEQMFAAFFVISWFVFSALIVKNLFVAVIIENFDIATTIADIKEPGNIVALRHMIARSYQGLRLRTTLVHRGEIHIDINTGEESVGPEADMEERRRKFLANSTGTMRDSTTELGGTFRGSVKEIRGSRKHIGAGAGFPGKSERSSIHSEAGTIRDEGPIKPGTKAVGAGRRSLTSPLALLAQGVSPENATRGRLLSMTQSLPDDKAEDVLAENESKKEDSNNQGQAKAQESKMDAYTRVLSAVTVQRDPVEEQRRREEEDSLERVLFFIEHTHPLRRVCLFLNNSTLFEFVVQATIIASCVMLVFDPPARDIPGYAYPVLDEAALDAWGIASLCIFSFEFVVRVISYGLVDTRYGYLKNGWNQMDFGVLALGYLEASGLSAGNAFSRVLRLTRTLRPLRLMKRNQGMRVVIDALITTLPPVMYVMLFWAFSLLVFGIIGKGILGGRLFSCTTPGAEFPAGKTECTGLHVNEAGWLVQRSWVNPPFNFDTVLESMLALFRVNTDKYVDVLFASMDAADRDVSPAPYHSRSNSLFVVAFLVVGSLFTRNLFVAFIVDGFNANKGSTKEEMLYNRFVRQISLVRPKRAVFKEPQNPVSVRARKILSNTFFQLFSTVCVLINMTFMLSDHKGASPEFVELLELQNLIFFLVLAVEVAIAIVGCGPGGVIDDKWKLFDLVVVSGTAAGYASNAKALTQFVRGFRLLRIFRLMNKIKAIKVIFETVISSAPQLGNILILLCIVYTMAAVAGTQIFGTTKYGSRLGPTANFDSFPEAFKTMYLLVVGDEWQMLAVDCAVQPPYCTPQFTRAEIGEDWDRPDLSFGDCGTLASQFYFIIFNIIGESIMLNLFVGMILDNFSFITEEVGMKEDYEWTAGASTKQLKEMAEVFRSFDRNTARLSLYVLPDLLYYLPLPLGFRKERHSIKIGHRERAESLLIRAELNLIVLEQRNEQLRQRVHTWRRFLFYSGVDERTQMVSFQDVMRTLIFWRKPDMVPHYIKGKRHDRVIQIAQMANALIVADFLRSVLGRKRTRATLKKHAHRVAFREFEKGDDVRQRRKQVIVQQVAFERKVAFKQARPRHLLHQENKKVGEVELVKVDKLPANLVFHEEATREGRFGIVHAGMSIETFLILSKTHRVMLRFVDPRHAALGYLLADFRATKWTGWRRTDNEHDSFFQPITTAMGILRPEVTGWSKVQLTTKVGNSHTTKDMVKVLGAIVDVQGYVEAFWEDDENPAGDLPPRNVGAMLRINTGSHRFEELAFISNSLDMTPEGIEAEEGKLNENGVLSVIGYVPPGTELDQMVLKEGFVRPADRALHDSPAVDEALIVDRRPREQQSVWARFQDAAFLRKVQGGQSYAKAWQLAAGDKRPTGAREAARTKWAGVRKNMIGARAVVSAFQAADEQKQRERLEKSRNDIILAARTASVASSSGSVVFGRLGSVLSAASSAAGASSVGGQGSGKRAKEVTHGPEMHDSSHISTGQDAGGGAGEATGVVETATMDVTGSPPGASALVRLRQVARRGSGAGWLAASGLARVHPLSSDRALPASEHAREHQLLQDGRVGTTQTAGYGQERDGVDQSNLNVPA